jgi:hypothetical protein
VPARIVDRSKQDRMGTRRPGTDIDHRSGGRTQMSNMWSYRDASWLEGGDLVGYDVEASDGSIGKIDDTTNETDAAHVVVDTGPWIFGKKRLIPAGAVSSVDHDSKTVMVNMTKDEIKSAPDYDESDSSWDDDTRSRYDTYYGRYSAW